MGVQVFSQLALALSHLRLVHLAISAKLLLFLICNIACCMRLDLDNVLLRNQAGNSFTILLELMWMIGGTSILAPAGIEFFLFLVGFKAEFTHILSDFRLKAINCNQVLGKG